MWRIAFRQECQLRVNSGIHGREAQRATPTHVLPGKEVGVAHLLLLRVCQWLSGSGLLDLAYVRGSPGGPPRATLYVATCLPASRPRRSCPCSVGVLHAHDDETFRRATCRGVRPGTTFRSSKFDYSANSTPLFATKACKESATQVTNANGSEAHPKAVATGGKSAHDMGASSGASSSQLQSASRLEPLVVILFDLQSATFWTKNSQSTTCTTSA